jgi:hypothetical protein
VLLYHGTHVDFATALEAGSPLDQRIAAANHIDGEPGFYLATAVSDAEFFAARRWLGRIVVYELTDVALDKFAMAGATLRPIPGGRPPYVVGSELFVPSDLFSLFNKLGRDGEIVVRT